MNPRRDPLTGVPRVLQIRARGGAAVLGERSLPVPDTRVPHEAQPGGQRGLRPQHVPQCTAAEDTARGRLPHQQLRAGELPGRF